MTGGTQVHKAVCKMSHWAFINRRCLKNSSPWWCPKTVSSIVLAPRHLFAEVLGLIRVFSQENSSLTKYWVTWHQCFNHAANSSMMLVVTNAVHPKSTLFSPSWIIKNDGWKNLDQLRQDSQCNKHKTLLRKSFVIYVFNYFKTYSTS